MARAYQVNHPEPESRVVLFEAVRKRIDRPVSGPFKRSSY